MECEDSVEGMRWRGTRWSEDSVEGTRWCGDSVKGYGNSVESTRWNVRD